MNSHPTRQARVIIGHALPDSHRFSAFRRPNPWNVSATFGACALRSNSVSTNEIPESGNQLFATIRTNRILPWTHVTRRVAGLDKTQSRFRADFRRAHQLRRGGSGPVGHLVILMKRRHMPRNIAVD